MTAPSKPLRMSAAERGIHQSIIDYLRLILPESHKAVHLRNNPRSRVMGGSEKRLGALKGIPDIAVIRPLGRIAFIEVKAEKGRLSPEQADFRLWCVRWGVPHCVARSIEDVRGFLDAIGIETKKEGRAV